MASDDITTVAITINDVPAPLLEQFDELVRGHTSRSNAVRLLMQAAVQGHFSFTGAALIVSVEQPRPKKEVKSESVKATP